MSLMHKCLNGRLLLISNEGEAIREITKNDIFPSVVLMTAWTQESVKSESLLIQKLLKLGCTYFVCAGPYSEDLHDFVDELSEAAEEKSFGITTTYHDDEPVDLVVNFFVTTTNLSSQESEGLVAILNDDCLEDDVFKEELLRS